MCFGFLCNVSAKGKMPGMEISRRLLSSKQIAWQHAADPLDIDDFC